MSQKDLLRELKLTIADMTKEKNDAIELSSTKDTKINGELNNNNERKTMSWLVYKAKVVGTYTFIYAQKVWGLLPF